MMLRASCVGGDFQRATVGAERARLRLTSHLHVPLKPSSRHSVQRNRDFRVASGAPLKTPSFTWARARLNPDETCLWGKVSPKMDAAGCTRGFLIVFCAVFWVSGISLITVGALCRTTFSRMESFTGPAMTHTPTALAVLGAAISLIALSGSFGAWAGSRVLLGLFAGLLMLILAVEIVGGILLYIFSSKVEEKFTSKAKAVITEYNMKDKAAIDELQSKFQCCGAVNYTDWFHSRGWHNGTSVPDSCCQFSFGACGKNAVTGKIYRKGCVRAIKVYLEKNTVGLGATCISLLTMELLGTLLGLCLLHNIPDGKRTKSSDD